MRFGEMLDAAVRLLRRTFSQVLVLIVLTLGSFTLLQTLVAPAPVSPFADPASFTFTTADAVRAGVSVLIVIVSQLFVLPLVRGAVTGIAVEADRGGDTSWQAGLAIARRLAGRLIGLSFLLLLLGLLAVAVLGVVFGVPLFVLITNDQVVGAVLFGLVAVLVTLAVAVVATALVYVAVPVLLVEEAGPTAALRRSVALVWPQFWRVLGIVLLTGLLVLVVNGVLGVSSLPFLLLGGVGAQLGNAVITTAAFVLTVPFQANVALLLYVDSRVRTEGLDVAVLTAELDRL